MKTHLRKLALALVICGLSPFAFANDETIPTNNQEPQQIEEQIVDTYAIEALNAEPLYNPCWRNPTGSSLCRARNFCGASRWHEKCQWYCSQVPRDEICRRGGGGWDDGRDFCRRYPHDRRCRGNDWDRDRDRREYCRRYPHDRRCN